jgi:hypothetical protein
MHIDYFDEFISSDIQDWDTARLYIGYAINVRDGHHSALELSGNACHVFFS